MEDQERYTSLLTNLKSDIAEARLKASLTVNEQLLQLYWRIGQNINLQRNEEGWGTKIIGRLSIDWIKHSKMTLSGQIKKVPFAS